MDPTSASSASPDAATAYAVAIASRSKDQQRVEGAEAVRLIDGATTSGGSGPRPLPPDATISIRV